MNYEDIAKKLGLNALEESIRDMVIPWLEEKVKSTDNTWDDMLLEKVKPALMELIDKINGVKDNE